MTNLILCDGYCDECAGNQDCPLKHEVQQKSKCWDCDQNPLPLNYRQVLWDNLNPSWLCKTFGISITNLLNSLELTIESDQEDHLLGIIFDHIQGCVSQDEQFIEMLDQKCCRDLSKRFMNLKTHMAKRIVLVFYGECPAEGCGSCWMVADCQQRDRSIAHI